MSKSEKRVIQFLMFCIILAGLLRGVDRGYLQEQCAKFLITQKSYIPSLMDPRGRLEPAVWRVILNGPEKGSYDLGKDEEANFQKGDEVIATYGERRLFGGIIIHSLKLE
jgi:hypothetical protein